MRDNYTPSSGVHLHFKEQSTISYETAFLQRNLLSGKFLVIGNVSLTRFFDLFGQQTIKN